MAARLTEPLYTRDILRLAASVAPCEPLARTDGAAELRSPTCGSKIAVAVMIEDGRIAAMSQKVEACAFGQAAAALMAAAAPGCNLTQTRAMLAAAEAWLAGDDAAAPHLAALAPARTRPGRHGAILLPFRALVAAVEAAA